MTSYPFLRRHALALMAIAFLGSACLDGGGSTSGSTILATSEIRAVMTVTASEPDRARVRVRLEDENAFGTGASPVRLDGIERLEAWIGGVSRMLVIDPAASAPSYVAEFDGVPATGPVQIDYRRADGSVVVSSVMLEPAFSVTRPAEGDRFDVLDDLVVEWTPGLPGQVSRIWITLDCPTISGASLGRTFFLQIMDDGSYVYPLGLIPELADPDLDRSQDCTFGLRFVREASSAIAPPYDTFSTLESRQSRSVENLTIGF